ncbi:MAG: hypothetical protein R2822_14685 [Spirosomataceae bacterium]
MDNLPHLNSSTSYKDAIEGQCLFLRGLMYFDLMRAYAYTPKPLCRDKTWAECRCCSQV